MVLQKLWVLQIFIEFVFGGYVYASGSLDIFPQGLGQESLEVLIVCKWCLHILHPEHIAHKVLWNLSFAIDKVKIVWAYNEKC